MKIAYFTHQYFPRHIGGTEIYLRGLALRAQAAGHEVIVITYHEVGAVEDFGVRRFTLDGVQVAEIHYSLGASSHPARCEYDNAHIGGLVQNILEAFSPDLVHAMHTMKLSAAVLDVCYTLSIPVIVTLCDFWYICPRHTLLKWNSEVCEGPRTPLSCVKCLQHTHGVASTKIWNRRSPLSTRRLRALVRDLAAISQRPSHLKETICRARRVIALSSFQKTMFVRNGYADERIEVCEHGLEVSDLNGAIAETGKSEPRVLFIGSMVSHKGPHVLLDALKLVPDLKVQCHIYGPIHVENAYAQRLQADAAKDERITFKGGFPPEHLGSILGGADLFVMPALWYENEPLIIKAALHMGIPIIASDIGSLPEMLENGERGMLVKPGDPKALASALQTALQKDNSGKRIPHPVKSIDENAKEMFAIYQKELLTS